ncbi:hypothetical protein ACP70R_014412 [Stipagrostis hirtigluma subsp. patula]
MIRRFVNLVVQNHESRMYSLHRLDVAKHLFYPSTADAEAAAATNASNNASDGRVGGGTPKPQMIERLRRLPAPSMRFQPSPEVADPPVVGDMFMLLSPRSSESSILHTSSDGHALLYDADSCSASTMPGFNEPEQPIPVAIAAAAGPRDQERESLYMMTSVDHSHGFKVLDVGRYHHPPRWKPLPPPPFAGDDSITFCEITSFTAVDGGRTICVSCEEPGVVDKGYGGFGFGSGVINRTYCFDTASHEWRRAGEWALPFNGRAEYVPEINTWVGFSALYPHHLCSSDLSAVAAMGAPLEAPTLEHVWEDLSLPPDEEVSSVLHRRFPGIVHRMTTEWRPECLGLVNLGSGRFCVAKAVQVMQNLSLCYCYENVGKPRAEFAVLTGVEVVRRGEGELRMVKHKSKRYVFTSDKIKWVF